MTVEGRGTNRPLVLTSILLAMFMVAIEATIIATAMPQIVAKLGGFALYSWVFAAFLLTQAATTVLFGKLADLYGRRPVMVWGIVVFLIGSLLCGFAWSMPSLILFRLIQGVGAGAILPTAMTIVGDLYTPEERGSIQGYLSSVWGISAIVGPLVGGLIVERFSWPWVFWINIPIGIATMFGLMRFMHEGIERKRHEVDYLGAAIFAVAISALLLLLTMISEPRSNHALTVGCGVLLLVMVPLFIWQERRAKEPMLALDLWTDRVIASANGASLAAGMTLMGLTTFLAVYVQGVMGYSATIAGLALTMMAVGWPVASVVSRRFYEWMGMRGTLRFGSFLLIVGSLVLILLKPSSSPILAGAGSLVMGFGMGLLNITVILLVQGSVPWSRRGSATASNVFSRNLGSTLGATVLGTVLNLGLSDYPGVSLEGIRQLLGKQGGDPKLRMALDHGLHMTFWCVVVLSVLTMLLALFIPGSTLSELSGGVGESSAGGE